jgi:hypothetical protein
MTTTATPAVKATVIISDSRLIADNLLDGLTIKEKTAQIRALTAMDKAQLGSGIRNGTWTYD